MCILWEACEHLIHMHVITISFVLDETGITLTQLESCWLELFCLFVQQSPSHLFGCLFVCATSCVHEMNLNSSQSHFKPQPILHSPIHKSSFAAYSGLPHNVLQNNKHTDASSLVWSSLRLAPVTDRAFTYFATEAGSTENVPLTSRFMAEFI